MATGANAAAELARRAAMAIFIVDSFDDAEDFVRHSIVSKIEKEIVSLSSLRLGSKN